MIPVAGVHELGNARLAIAAGERLRRAGLDPNQIAEILWQRDPIGFNYGVGVVLNGDGRPMATPPEIVDAVIRETLESQLAVYRTLSNDDRERLKEAVLDWQGCPAALRSRFEIAVISDSGTGALQTGLQLEALMNGQAERTAIRPRGWPAYRALAASAQLSFDDGENALARLDRRTIVVHQAGPHNTSGAVESAMDLREAARRIGAAGASLVLDRAYPAFEHAGRVASEGLAAVSQRSFEEQVLPFVDEGIPFSLALSPTKAFRTFALRPAGFLLIHTPDHQTRDRVRAALPGLVRARGASSSHPATRALVALLMDRSLALARAHEESLARTARAEAAWRTLCRGTALEPLFGPGSGGLFRNILMDAQRQPRVYDAHVYPVFFEDRCRINITGLPEDLEMARSHVALFAAPSE